MSISEICNDGPSYRVGEAPRATPFGLARLPNIDLSVMYQIHVNEDATLCSLAFYHYYLHEKQKGTITGLKFRSEFNSESNCEGSLFKKYSAILSYLSWIGCL